MTTHCVQRSLRPSSLAMAFAIAGCEAPTVALGPVESRSSAGFDQLITASSPATPFNFGVANVHPAGRCTYDDTQLIFNSWLAVLKHGLRATIPSKPADAFTECQYRLFFDGTTINFKEGDVILGGINVLWDFETLSAFGITREEAIADLETTDTRVWLARVETDGTVGEFVEQLLLRTPYKDGMHHAFGRFVQQHRAFVTSLSSGEYLSVFEAKWNEFHGFPAGGINSTVRLVVTQ